MDSTIKSPGRAKVELDLLAARQQQREYVDMGELTLAGMWEKRVDELLVQWVELSA